MDLVVWLLNVCLPILLNRVRLNFLNSCCENWSNLMLGESGWKHVAQQIFLAHKTIYFSQLLRTNLLPKTIVSKVQPAFICMNSAMKTVE